MDDTKPGKAYKWCIAPLCTNTSTHTPDKLFIRVPDALKRRQLWLRKAGRDPSDYSNRSTIYCCEDHFDLPNDMENWVQFNIMGGQIQKKMKKDVVPHRFLCDMDRKTTHALSSEKSLANMTMDLGYFSRDFFTEFIKLYRSYPCLWKRNDKIYRDKRKREAAYEDLVMKLREIIPDATRNTVIKKMNAIRNCFRKEARKVESYQKAGKMYVPTLWYYNLLEFLLDLKDTNDIRHSISNLKTEINEEVFLASDIKYEQESLTPSLTSTDTNDILNTFEDVSYMSPNSSETILNVNSVNNLQNINQSIEGNLNTSYEKRIKYDENDEFDIIGQNVAIKLRRLSREDRIYTEKLINDVLFKAEIGQIKNTKIS